MKKYIIFACFQLVSIGAIAQTQLENSRWKIHTEVPRSADLQYEFKKDTLTVFNESGVAIQSMLFSQRQDTLYLKLISGTSPCPTGSEGWYTVVWQENGAKFLLKNIKDGCTSRINRLTNMQVIQRIH